MAGFFSALRIEWLKVSSYRTFWILLAIIAICMPGFNYVVYSFTDNSLPKMNGQSILGAPFSYPSVWKTVPYNAGSLVFIPAILVITLFTNEFTFRTHRQNIIDGWSRDRFIGLKIAETVMVALFVTIVNFATCIYFGSITHSTVAPGWSEYRFLLYFFIGTLDYMMIALIISQFIRRAGLAMGVFFLYLIVEQVLVITGRNKYHWGWVDYLPEEVTDKLIPSPLSKMFNSAGAVAQWEAALSGYLAVSVLYIALFTGIIIWRFRRADL